MNNQNTSQLFRRRYWTAFMEVVKANPGPLKPRSPSNRNWINFAIGKSNVQLGAVIAPTKPWIFAEIHLSGAHAKARFQQLLSHKTSIEQQVGTLDWQELPKKQACRIKRQMADTDSTDESDWKRQHEWLRDTLKAFHVAFSPFVKQLQDDANALSEPDEDDNAFG